MTMSLSEEDTIRNQIAELRAKLPKEPHEPAEPLHAVVSKVFLDGAVHTRTVDLANEWKRVGTGIREAVRQGGEVVVRPLYAGEGVQEHKEYPSTRRIKALEEEASKLHELRDALVDSMGTEGGIPMTDRLARAMEACGAL
jgi:hypothetical protein